MNRLLTILIVSIALLSCQDVKTIPDDKLSLIMQDLALVNAYAQQNRVNTDSIDIYTPIFDKYGYTMADFRYTLTTFAKRKSMRVTDVITQTTKLLETDFNIYNTRVATLDSVDARSRRMFSKRIDVDSIIVVRRVSDTAKLRKKLPVKEGTYNISYRYTLDSLDTNYGMRSVVTVQDSNKISHTANTQWLSPRASKRISMSVDVPRATKQLVLSLGGYGENMVAPHLTIDSLIIIYLPPVKEALQRATDSLFKYKFKIDNVLFPPKDSLTPPLYAPRVDSLGRGKSR